MLPGPVDNYHMCRGVKRRGMTYDPGAAGDLVGTDTVLDYDAGAPPLHGERTLAPSIHFWAADVINETVSATRFLQLIPHRLRVI